jgi:hypothetical protein
VRVGDASTSVYTITPGSLVTVPIQVVGAANLGAAMVAVTYDPAVVQPVSCAQPVTSAFDGGACHLAYAPDTVRFNVVAVYGFSGTATMMEIVFQGVGDSAMRSDLRLAVAHFADLTGNALPVSTASGAIHLAGSPPAVPVLMRVGEPLQSIFSISPGRSTDIPLTFQISDTVSMGAASLLLRYDPAIVRPTRCTVAASLQGYCNPGFDPVQGLLKFTLISEAGLSGAQRPFTVTFEAASGVTSGESDLSLGVENLADTTGARLARQTINGLVRVSGPAAASALVRVGEASGAYTVSHGLTRTVGIWVQDAANLGAATLALRFDPAIMRAVDCTMPGSAEPAGRGQQMRTDAGLSEGVCTISAGQARVSLVASAGLTGTQRLVDITFTPAVGAAVGASTSLSLTVENFADTMAQPLTSRVRNGSLTVAPGEGATRWLVRVGTSADGGAYELPLTSRAVVTLTLEGAGTIGAASVDISYNRAVARAVACSPSPTSASGFCNPAADGVVRLAVLSGAAFSGTMTLGTIAFQPADGALAGAATPLTVTVTNLAGALGEPLLYQTASGWLTLTPAPAREPQVTLRAGEGVYPIGIGGLATVGISATVATSDMQQGLAAATLLLNYDPALVAPVRCALRTAWWGGVCNLAYAPGQLRLNALSAAGLTGTVGIAEVVFRGIGLPGQMVTTPLTLTVSNLADSAARPLTYLALASAIRVTAADGDRDGVGDDVEARAPNGGDGNGDGIPDAQQLNVTSLPNAGNGAYVTLAGPAGALLEEVHVNALPDTPPSANVVPAGATFPLGRFDFKIRSVAPGGAAVLTLFLPAKAGIDTLYKFGPEPGNPEPHWYRFDFDGSTGCRAYPDRIVIYYVDGGRGDSDLTANGVIAGRMMPAHAGYDILPGAPKLLYLPLLAR